MQFGRDRSALAVQELTHRVADVDIEANLLRVDLLGP